MKEYIQKSAKDLIEVAKDGLSTAGDFLGAEIPEGLQQLLMWHGISSLILGILLVLAFVGSAFNMTKIYKKGVPLAEQRFGIFYLAALMLAISIFAISELGNALKIWTAPKVWIIEYSANLIG